MTKNWWIQIFAFHNSLFSVLEEHVILFSEFLTQIKKYFAYDSFKKFHSLSLSLFHYCQKQFLKPFSSGFSGKVVFFSNANKWFFTLPFKTRCSTKSACTITNFKMPPKLGQNILTDKYKLRGTSRCLPPPPPNQPGDVKIGGHVPPQLWVGCRSFGGAKIGN